MRAVIGITGSIRSGKSTIQEIIIQNLLDKKLRVKKVTFSDVLMDICHICGQLATRDNLIGIVSKLKELWGKDWLAKAIQKRIIQLDADIIVLAGLRWYNEDLPLLRSLPNNYLVYVDAPLEVRWQRSLNDPEKPDETNATFEQFKMRDLAITEVEIPLFKQHADFVVDNFGFTKSELGDVVREFLKRMSF